MSCKLRDICVVGLIVAFLSSASLLYGADLKPGGVNSSTVAGPGLNGNPNIRDLRVNSGGIPDFVRTWHIFADTAHNGILDPGDSRVSAFQNWWTPVSAATQHGHEIGAPAAAGPDYPSTPIDHQANYTHNVVQGLPQEAGTIGFYMTYSHMDNADFDNEFLSDGTPQATFQQRNRERNGYAMGWLIGETEVDSFRTVQYGQNTGNVKMDIFVHKGKSDNNALGTGADDNHNFGINPVTNQPYSTVSRSEPQVVQSNDMFLTARQDDNLMLVPDYKDDFVITNPTDPSGYSYGPDDGYLYDGFNENKYLVDGDLNPATPANPATEAQFNTVVASMDVREVNSYETTPGANDDLGGIAPIHPDFKPQQLLDDGVKDGLGNDLYFYEDSFFQRDGSVGGDLNDGSKWIEGSTDGGVIAGLSGYDGYSEYYTPQGALMDPTGLYTRWGEQQVIRIDFDQATFDMLGQNGIREIVFYDWGDIDPVTGQQMNPTPIRINVDADQKLYYENDGVPGLSAGDILFPDNRIYIAQVEHAPEPATMIVLVSGGVALLAKRRRRQK